MLKWINESCFSSHASVSLISASKHQPKVKQQQSTRANRKDTKQAESNLSKWWKGIEMKSDARESSEQMANTHV